MNDTTPSIRNRVGYYLLYAALAIMAIAIAVLLRWSFQSEKVLQLNNTPFPVRVVPSSEGSVVILTSDYCKFQNISGTVRISFVSESRETFLPISPEKGPKVCQKVDLPILIPKDLPSDSYKVKFHAVYDINPLKQNIPVDFESKSFKL